MIDPWMQTFSGGVFDFEDIGNSVITLEDIAAALSHTCRFGGHTTVFYSVAEHSLLVALQLEINLHGVMTPSQALSALLHDAHEAYVGDIIAPLKAIPAIREAFSPLIRRIDARIFDTFGIPLPDEDLAREIHRADLMVLLAEQRDLLVPCVREWGVEDLQPSPLGCIGFPPERMHSKFRRACRSWGLEERDR